MTNLKNISNQEFLQELKSRITENKIGQEELFKLLENNEIVTKCETADLSKLTKED